MINSLAGRLAVAASVVLLGFMIATGFALEKAFESSALQAMRDRLKGLSFALLGAAEVAADGSFHIDENFIPDERLLQPDSGLSALVLSENGRVLWRSVSSTGVITLPKAPGVGEWLFVESHSPDVPFVLAFGLQWTLEDSLSERYVLLLVEQADTYVAQLGDFRKTLFTWLFASALVLLLAQLAVLRWGLKPLRTVIMELKRIESGERERLEGHYPKELAPLVEGMNALLSHERGRQVRTRNALDDLAHSAKTPLAVLRGFIDQGEFNSRDRKKFGEQIERLDQIVRYQLQRAATRGRSGLLSGQLIAPGVGKIKSTLSKVYRDKNVQFTADFPQDLTLVVDADDLMELWGNLLDNAYKWCRSRVRLSAIRDQGSIHIYVDDDGPGFPEHIESGLMQRGARADSRVEGQGIGLAVVAEITKAYDGEIRLEKSSWGGARVSLRFPAS